MDDDRRKMGGLLLGLAALALAAALVLYALPDAAG